jgi:Holliday junction DNA helicase RuvB
MTERTKITTPEALGDEEPVENSLRPQRLAEFIGQDKVRKALSIAIEAAKQRREPLDHLLFHGPPGLGKTTLASLMARELGVNIKTTSGPVLEKPADLVGILTNQREGDILFIDEIHRLRPIIEEFLYPAMEDWQVDIRLSDGPRAQTMTMKIERLTLVGATTSFGLLTAPARFESRISCGRRRLGTESTHCRIGTAGTTLSLRCTATSAMRRFVQDGGYAPENSTHLRCDGVQRSGGESLRV